MTFPFVVEGAQLLGPRYKVKVNRGSGATKHNARELSFMMPTNNNTITGVVKSFAEVCLD